MFSIVCKGKGQHGNEPESVFFLIANRELENVASLCANEEVA